jgi:uncharacterized protein DUF3575
MMFNRNYLLLIFLFIVNCCIGQDLTDSTSAADNFSSAKKRSLHQHDSISVKHNGIKINVYSLFINNYSVSFERLIGRKISVQLGYRYQPYNYLMENPFGRFLTKKGAPIDYAYYNFKTSNNTFTLDFKFYTGKKPGMQGLWFGAFGRYAMFDADNTDFNYITESDVEYKVPLVSNFHAWGGGIIAGRQWIIKKLITVEYTLGFQLCEFGGSVISHKDLSGLTAQQKGEVKADISDLFFINDKSYISNLIVDDKGVNGQITGPFLGIRSALTVGIIF